MPVEACIALGSNLGDRAANIARAIEMIGALPGTSVVKASRVHATAAVMTAAGVNPGGEFLNAAVRIATSLEPGSLLSELKGIERALGRDASRQPHGGARSIDLDILLYADQVIDQPGLRVPHAGLCERLFVLQPLNEVAAEWIVPGTGKAVQCILEEAL